MHYEFTGESKVTRNGVYQSIVHRIRATKDLPAFGVKKGDIGGWIGGTSRLTENIKGWVADEAIVIGDSLIGENVEIGQNAVIMDTKLNGDSIVVIGNSRIEFCTIMGKGLIDGKTILSNNDIDVENFKITDNVELKNSTLYGAAMFFREQASCNRLYVPNDVFYVSNITIDGHFSINGKLKIQGRHIHLGGFSSLEGNFTINKNAIELIGIKNIVNQKEEIVEIKQSVLSDEEDIIYS